MSRTGVGCRVLIDGEILDDGCFNWDTGHYGPPWAELRRNYVLDPRGITLSGYGSTLSVLSSIPEGGVRSTRSATGNSRVLDVQLPSVGVIGSRITIKGQIKNPNTLTVSHRANLASSSAGTVALTPGTLANASDWQDFECSGVLAVAPTATAGITFITANGAAGAVTGFRNLQVEIAPPPLGPYFDGSMTATAVDLRNRWTGVVNASASVIERGTWTPDTPSGMVPQGVAAAEGLAIAWGRSTTVDQPDISTCTFTVIDDVGGATVLDTIRLGARVDVLADATISGGGGSNQAFTDPGFDTGVRGTPTNAVLARSQRRVETPGGWAAQIVPVVPERTATVIMPPGDLQAPGTNPAAWAALQSTAPGESWTVRVRMYIPDLSTVRIRPVLYSGPYVDAATISTASQTAYGPGWATAEVTFAPGVAAMWVGVAVDVVGSISWNDVPPAQTWADVAPDLTWEDLIAVYLDRVDVLGPGSGNAVSVMVFSGRITDLQGAYDQSWDVPSVNVTASDFLADLGNRYIGDEPWVLEPVSSRITRILALAARPDEGAISVDLAPTLAPVPMSWQDVDRQQAAGLLKDVAQSVDGVLWSATHPVIGPYVRLEDPAQRLALYQLELVSGSIVIVQIDFADMENPPPMLSACDILRDPVQFDLDVSDIATRTEVGWKFQTVDEDGNPTTEDRKAVTINQSLEDEYGTRSVSVETILAAELDARNVSEKLIARLGSYWRISGLAVTDEDIEVPDAAAAQMFVTMLNGVTRGGQPLIINDLPYWSPTGVSTPVYIEGGTYTFTGGWDLEINVSRAAGMGQAAKWDELPNTAAWMWDAWDPSITWDDLRGVAAP